MSVKSLFSLVILVIFSLIFSGSAFSAGKPPLSFKPDPAKTELIMKGKGLQPSSSTVSPSQTPPTINIDKCTKLVRDANWKEGITYKLVGDLFLDSGNYCLQIGPMSKATIDCNGKSIINHNPGAGSETFGIMLDKSDFVVLKDCRVYGFGTGLFIGENNKDITVQKSHFINSYGDGIAIGLSNTNFLPSSRVTLYGNQMLNNGGAGVSINNAKDITIGKSPTITGNTIQGNGIGVEINGNLDAASIKMDSMLISNNETFGIYIRSSSYNSINNVMACGNATADLYCEGTAAQTTGISGSGNQFSKVVQCTGSDKWPVLNLAYEATCPLLMIPTPQ